VSHEQTASPHLLAYLERRQIAADFVAPGVPMPTVTLAAQAVGVPVDRILKTLVFAADDGSFVVAIASGNDRIDRNRLAAAAGVARLRAAKPEDVLRVTGFPAGGVAPLGLPENLTVVVDRTTATLDTAYGGGGHEAVLLRVRLSDVVRHNDAIVADLREQRPAAP
jgi:Cys-tRNA(Pro) deacylase